MTWRSTVILSVLAGLLCIPFALVKSEPVAEQPDGQNNGIGGDMDPPNFEMTAFSNILRSKLENSEVLTRFFLERADRVNLANIASSITESFVLEVGLVDSYSATELMTDALLSVNSGTEPEAYCTKLINIVGKILLDNKILNSGNYFALANIVSQIILNAASDSLNSTKTFGFGNENKLKKDISAGLGIAARAGLGINAGAGIGIGAKSSLDATGNINVGAGLGGNVLGLGLNSADVGLRNNIILGANGNLDSNADTNSLLDVDIGLPVKADSPSDVGVKIDLDVSEEANLQFKTELTNKLLKDINVKNIFADFVPPNALKQIAAAICQYISKAFHVSRSFLLPLETSIGNLSIDVTPCPELYANIIAGTLKNLFVNAKFITKSTASLQATIAANVVTSAISSFIRIATIPGISISQNPFNSYFSALNGLGKLPYVGIEASSPKLPLAVKLTYASKYASQFANILFFNLIYSNRFLEIFRLGVPIFSNKITAKSLGNFVADAFGSPNPNLFYDLLCKALLTTALKINSASFAKAISTATARALFLNGYFLSGNLDIQAAIAKNAIIRALITRIRPVTSQVTLFPISGLPWVTQLEGVLPSQILLKYGTDIGLNANSGLGLGVDESSKTNINAALGAGVNVNSGLGANVNSGLGLGANVNLGTNLVTNPNLGATLGVKSGLGANVDLRGGLDANAGLGNGLISNAGLAAGLGLITDVNTGNSITADLGANIGANVGLGGGLNANTGLAGGLGANVGLGGGLNSNAGLAGGLGVNAGLGTGADLGANLGIYGGLGTGLGVNAGLGAVGRVNSDLKTVADVNTGLRAAGDINTNFGTIADVNAGIFGAVAGWNTGLKSGQGINTGLDVNAGLGAISGYNSGFDKNQGNFVGLKLIRKKRSGGINTGVGLGLNANAGLGLGLNANADLDVALDANAGVDIGLGTGVNARLGAGAKTTVETGSNSAVSADVGLGIAAADSSNTQLSVLDVLPLILANKLYQSTAVYTSVSMIGIRKIISLISQAMAAEFGLPIATIFLRSYAQFVLDNADNSIEINIVGLAKATTEALAGSGFLNSKFSLSTANQLADAIVAKFSSLITSSLEAKECTTAPQWTKLLNQDSVQPSLIPGYNTFK